MTPAEQQTARPVDPRPRRAPAVLVAVLLAAGAAVSYVGIRSQPLAGTEPAPEAAAPADPVVRIDLPYEEFPLPAGPHRERFQVHCMVCHSPRLAFTQPPLPEKKWQEVVRKMVAVYGAPFGPEEEREIVTYLTSANGQTTP